MTEYMKKLIKQYPYLERLCETFLFTTEGFIFEEKERSAFIYSTPKILFGVSKKEEAVKLLCCSK